MNIFFNFDYKGGKAYLGLKACPEMMDTLVTDINGLIDFLELRLGLHTPTVSDADRLVCYYKCVREYMAAHATEAGTLYDSYLVSPLATSREMLKWRDALSVCGWTKNTPAASSRLRVLQGIEALFETKKMPDEGHRLNAIAERLKQKKGMLKDVAFVMPFQPDLLHPVLKEIFALAQADGASVGQLPIPESDGNDNLARLKRMLKHNDASPLLFDSGDESVCIWNFKDDLTAEEYMATLANDTFDVSIKPSTKLIDNYLHLMGKPATGSIVANSSPQIIQLFFTGVAIQERPLNIRALLQWLYAPMHPLPGSLRYRLAEQLAHTGGWYSAESDNRGESCQQIVDDWVNGKETAKSKEHINKQEVAARKRLASVFLPSFDKADEGALTVEQFHRFLQELRDWSRQHTAVIAQKDSNDLRITQLGRLSELCNTLENLTDDLNPSAPIPYSEIEKHITCLYEPSEFQQYIAQTGSQPTVASPGQVAAKADRLLWSGLYDFKPLLPATDFLTPTEQEDLQPHIKLWSPDDTRKLQQEVLLLPILFCQKQLTLATVEVADGKIVDKHPLVVRIEQQVKNHREVTRTPEIPEELYIPTKPLSDNALSECDGYYTQIHRTDLITWKKTESPTSIETLIQYPLDYTLESIAGIRDNGQRDLSNVRRTKGNVAHAVIQHLFLIPDDPASGYAPAIRDRVNKDYERVFNETVEAKGAILLLQENVIERRELYDQLQECINHLLDIIECNCLHVVACEKPLKDGTPDPEPPAMKGFADMELAREDGSPVIFDFKWTSSRSYYQGLLKTNRAAQLAIYADLLGKEKRAVSVPTAYFLMPVGRLYSTEKFNGTHTETIKMDDSCHGDILGRIRASYHYRRDEIMSGKIEMGEGLPLDQLQYFNDTETRNLFPLKPDYNDAKIKDTNGFSNYSNLKN